MKIITVESLVELLHRHGIENFMSDLLRVLRDDFQNWQSFTQIPRPAMHVTDGVLELMPVCDNKSFYSFKYVNCHPKNPLLGKQTVVATGQLCDVKTGYPLIFSEMTLLTALRTACVSALATNVLARKNAKVLALIGTGAQSEFQVKSLQLVRNLDEVRYFDTDSNAMDKFEKNMSDTDVKLIRCKNAEEATKGADIITVCTASKAHVKVLKSEWITEGVHINALGGDTVGKTELDIHILKRSRITVEYFEQSIVEGEVQQLGHDEARRSVHAELYEIFQGKKSGRENNEEITLFDSVGIALEDYSALRLTYDLSKKYTIGEELSMVSELSNPKDLYGAIL